MNITTIQILVAKLNAAAYEQTEDCSTSINPFGVISNGEDVGIEFLGSTVWTSTDDPLGDDIHNETACFLEAVGKLDIPKLIALLPPDERDLS